MCVRSVMAVLSVDPPSVLLLRSRHARSFSLVSIRIQATMRADSVAHRINLPRYL
jgi:hypothetical protein